MGARAHPHRPSALAVAAIPLVRRRHLTTLEPTVRARAASRPFRPSTAGTADARAGASCAHPSAASTSPELTPSDIRRARLADDHEFRALIHAPAEAEARAVDARRHDPDEPRLDVVPRRPNASCSDHRPTTTPRSLSGSRAPGARPRRAEGGEAAPPRTPARRACRRTGSASSARPSPPSCRSSLSTLFGSDDLDQAEKKALVFTDSVQDAAHRAGFVQSRSHSLTLRAVLRGRSVTTRSASTCWSTG